MEEDVWEARLMAETVEEMLKEQIQEKQKQIIQLKEKLSAEVNVSKMKDLTIKNLKGVLDEVRKREINIEKSHNALTKKLAHYQSQHSSMRNWSFAKKLVWLFGIKMHPMFETHDQG